MRLIDISYTLLENVEKAAPMLEKYICGLIAKPYKQFMAKHGLELKKFYEELSEESLNKISAALPTAGSVSLYSYAALKAISLSWRGEFTRDIQSDWPELWKNLYDLLNKYRSVGQSIDKHDHLFLIKVIDNKSLPANMVQDVFNCDPVYMRGSALGISPDKLKAPFAKAIGRWVYDPEVQRDLSLPQDAEFLREQLALFNKARSKGLNIDIDSVASYEQFMQIMEPYQTDLDKVDKYALSGLDLVARVGIYRIWDLSWIPDDEDPTLHKVIGDAGWCVKRSSHYRNYIAKGKCYLVTKANKKYALIHFESGEYKNVQNTQISDPDASKVLAGLLASDDEIKHQFANSMYRKMPQFVAEVKKGDLTRLSGNFAQFRKSPSLLSVLSDYADKIGKEPLFKLQVAENAAYTAANWPDPEALILHLRQNNYVKDLEILAQVEPEIFVYIAEQIFQGSYDRTIRQIANAYLSYFHLSKPSSEIEEIINPQISQGSYGGFFSYIDLLSSAPQPDYDYILGIWATVFSRLLRTQLVFMKTLLPMTWIIP
jgi:hypothetical protein